MKSSPSSALVAKKAFSCYFEVGTFSAPVLERISPKPLSLRGSLWFVVEMDCGLPLAFLFSSCPDLVFPLPTCCRSRKRASF